MNKNQSRFGSKIQKKSSQELVCFPVYIQARDLLHEIYMHHKCFVLLFLAVFLFVGGCSFNLSDYDKNFSASSGKNTPAVQWHDALNSPDFTVEGFPWWRPGKILYRLPENMQGVNKGALKLANHTSGGVIRFRTDSSYLKFKADLTHYSIDMNSMPRGGTSGLDLYEHLPDGSSKYMGTFRPTPAELKDKILERDMKIGEKKMRSYLLILPLYNGMKMLQIGVTPDSRFEKAQSHRIAKPIVFYGSSITQGGCAMRPADNYTTMLCRELDAPQINLGFSGSAHGEPAMAQLIAKLDMEVFVMDYDYNALTWKELQKTHEPFFRIIREKHPKLPILILTRCSNIEEKRTAVCRKTFENAVRNGDKHVYFIDGKNLFGGISQDYCTIDGCHPNNLGFYQMYRTVLQVLRKAIRER